MPQQSFAGVKQRKQITKHSLYFRLFFSKHNFAPKYAIFTQDHNYLHISKL